MELFYIARFTGKHNKVPQGYEIRFQSRRRFPNLDELNKANSNKFYNEITEAALAQGMDKQLGITADIIKGLATEGHFSIDCPALRAEFEQKEVKKQNLQPVIAQKEKVTVQEHNNTREPKAAPKWEPKKTNGGSISQIFVGIYNIIYGIIFLLRRLLIGGWTFKEGASTGSKIWHIIKTIFRIAIIIIVVVLICVAYMIISSIIKES